MPQPILTILGEDSTHYLIAFPKSSKTYWLPRSLAIPPLVEAWEAQKVKAGTPDASELRVKDIGGKALLILPADISDEQIDGVLEGLIERHMDGIVKVLEEDDNGEDTQTAEGSEKTAVNVDALDAEMGGLEI